MLHRLMLQNALIAALAASVLAHTPALAKPVHRPADRSDSPAATSPRTWSPATTCRVPDAEDRDALHDRGRPLGRRARRRQGRGDPARPADVADQPARC